MQDIRADFQSVGRTHPGAVRPHNEDALIERSEIGLWAVSDGMGGHLAGDVASALVIEQLRKVTRQAGGQFIDAVRGAIGAANRELYEKGSLVSAATTMGATVVALGSEDGRFFCLWAGDSRAYRLRNGEFVRITRDHRYIQDLLDSGVLKESEAETHPRRNVITRAVGIESDVKLDVAEGEVQAGDLFLLASDGVTGVCKDAELAEILKTPDLNAAADKIVALCLDRGAPDNLSLILVKRQAK